MKRWMISLLGTGVFLIAGGAWADEPGAPATVSSDQDVEELDVEPGRVEMRNGGVSLGLNQQLSGPGGRDVQRVELATDRPAPC
jgi:hypothetical protein